LATDLQKAFPGIVVNTQATPTSTGWFEVVVGGKLVHSKKNGQGFVNTKESLDKVMTAVADCVKSGGK